MDRQTHYHMAENRAVDRRAFETEQQVRDAIAALKWPGITSIMPCTCYAGRRALGSPA